MNICISLTRKLLPELTLSSLLPCLACPLVCELPAVGPLLGSGSIPTTKTILRKPLLQEGMNEPLRLSL